MKPISIVLVDDSAICRQRLREILEAEGDISVVGEISDGRNVLPLLERLRPQVLLTDLLMPGLDGLGVVETVMRKAPLPIIIVSAGGFSQVSAYEAVRSGALEVAKKPSFGEAREERALRAAVRRLAGAFVIRHPGALPPPRPAPAAPAFRLGPQRVRVLGIGSSAGGPPAVASLLGALAAERGLSVVVAQHMPRDHVDDFAGFLSRRCSLPVTICTGAEQLEPGRVVLPGDGMNLVFTAPNRVAAVPSENPLVPSVDVLFHSMANHLGAACAAVVLSGIGNDGTSGLAALAERGALTLAQDEQSSAVFGMPKSAAPYARHHVSPVEAARVVLGHVALRSRGLSL